jgi:hypothetical protein
VTTWREKFVVSLGSQHVNDECLTSQLKLNLNVVSPNFPKLLGSYFNKNSKNNIAIFIKIC